MRSAPVTAERGFATLECEPGDEIITSPLTFSSDIAPMVRNGIIPAFVDVEPDTGNINVELIEAAITSRTKAIMPVSLYGQAADMDAINAIAAKHGVQSAHLGVTSKSRLQIGPWIVADVERINEVWATSLEKQLKPNY